MQSGVKPVKRDTRDLSFVRTFGGIKPLEFPLEFSVDLGLTMPDQIAENMPFGCTGFAQTELCSDQDGTVYDDYGWLYDKGLELSGKYVRGEGVEMRKSLKAVITFGPKKKSEKDGYGNRRGRYFNVDKKDFDWFDSIRSVMVTNPYKTAVSMATIWLPEFNTKIVDEFKPDISRASWHNWAVKGWKQINGEPYLIGKSWQGERVGDKGWTYFSRNAINKLLNIDGSGAFTVADALDENLATVKLTILETILEYIKQVFTLKAKLDNMSEVKPEVVEEIKPKVSKIKLMAEAIKEYEGWF